MIASLPGQACQGARLRRARAAAALRAGSVETPDPAGRMLAMAARARVAGHPQLLSRQSGGGALPLRIQLEFLGLYRRGGLLLVFPELISLLPIIRLDVAKIYGRWDVHKF